MLHEKKKKLKYHVVTEEKLDNTSTQIEEKQRKIVAPVGPSK
jgi:hypothetical protein